MFEKIQMTSKVFLSVFMSLSLASCSSIENNVSIDGYYERYIGNSLDVHHAFLDVVKQGGENYSISGIATWVGNVKIGNVNMGEVEGIFPLKNKTIHYDLNGCQLNIKFSYDSLLVSEDSQTCGGLNVRFDGYYKKAL